MIHSVAGFRRRMICDNGHQGGIYRAHWGREERDGIEIVGRHAANFSTSSKKLPSSH